MLIELYPEEVLTQQQIAGRDVVETGAGASPVTITPLDQYNLQPDLICAIACLTETFLFLVW